MNGSSPRVAILVTAVLAVALTACSKSNEVNAFAQACAKTQATQKMCECAAYAAASKFTPELYDATVYDMQGKMQEPDAISGKVSFDERASFAPPQHAIMGSRLEDSQVKSIVTSCSSCPFRL